MSEITGQASGLRFDFARSNFTGGAIDADHVVFTVDLAIDFGRLGFGIDFHRAGTSDAATSPTAGHHGGVAGHTARAGQNSGRGVHAVHVFRTGFLANQDDLLTRGGARLGIFGRERQLTNRGTWGGRQALGNFVGLRPSCGLKAGQQQLSQIASRHPQHSRLLVDQAFAEPCPRPT